MELLCIGVSHRIAPVEVREQFNLSAEHLTQLSQNFQQTQTYCHEMAVISTCNRVEFYAYSDNPQAAVDELTDIWATTVHSSSRHLSPYLYTYQGDSAANHLCRVSAGLDSIVIGEPQILGQVHRSYDTAVELGIADKRIRSLFQTAIRSGKRARTETSISKNPSSTSSIAIRLATTRLGTLDGKTVVMVGAGKMGQLALKSLQQFSVGQIHVVNRTLSTGQRVADEFGAMAHGMDALASLIPSADLIITSTDAPTTIINREMVEPLVADRTSPLVLIDIAVPRDIDPAINQLPNVTVFDVDDLQGHLDESIQMRRREIPSVEQIIEHELEIYERKDRELAIEPTILAVRSHAEALREKELAKLLRMNPAFDEETQAQLERFSRSLMNKILHTPTMQLRKYACDGDPEMIDHAMRAIFDLPLTPFKGKKHE